MSDAWVWLRCCGCGSNMRLVAFSGYWGSWSVGADDFVSKHMTYVCHGDKLYDMDQSRDGYAFIETVTEQQADATGGINSKIDRVKTDVLYPRNPA